MAIPLSIRENTLLNDINYMRSYKCKDNLWIDKLVIGYNDVGDKFEMSGLLILLRTCSNCHHHKVINITVTGYRSKRRFLFLKSL